MSQFTHINLLNVLDSQIRQTREFGGSPSVETLEGARAALANLIEAENAYDEAMARHYHAIHYGSLDDEGQFRIALTARAWRKAQEHRSAALARVL